MTRRRVLLALLVLVPALAFGASRIVFALERGRIEKGWEAGDADATLTRALAGVRLAFDAMVGDAEDAAGRVARAVEDLDFAAAPEGEDVERLASAVDSRQGDDVDG